MYDPLADTSQITDSIIFGPNISRRLGRAIGVNLLPPGKAACNYKCVYCLLTPLMKCIKQPHEIDGWLSPSKIGKNLQFALRELKNVGCEIENIVIIGNGEPTLHPQFKDVVSEIKVVRDAIDRSIKISLFTNGSLINRKQIKTGLLEVDNLFIKIDSVDEKLWYLINKPNLKLPLMKVLDNLLTFRKNYENKLVTSTTLIKAGGDKGFTNIDEIHITKLGDYLLDLDPDEVHLETPSLTPAWSGAIPVTKNELVIIGEKLSKKLGNKVYLLAGTTIPIPINLIKHFKKHYDLSLSSMKMHIINKKSLIPLLSSKGSLNRIKILEIIMKEPMSCNQIARKLGLNWWTVQKHLEVLKRENLIEPIIYGKRLLYKTSPFGVSVLSILKREGLYILSRLI